MSPGFGGFAVLVVFAVITGVIGYLAVLQAKVKRQIEDSRRERERENLASLGSIPPGTDILAPQIMPDSTPDITPSSLPQVTPGGTPTVHPNLHVLPPPDTGGHHAGGGTGSERGSFDSDAGGGTHHGSHS